MKTETKFRLQLDYTMHVLIYLLLFTASQGVLQEVAAQFHINCNYEYVISYHMEK